MYHKGIMGVMLSSLIMLIVSFLVSPSFAWVLPAKEFLEKFANTFQMEGVNIFLPDSRSNKWQVLSVMKHLSEARISVSAMDENRRGNMSRNPKMLYVTTASSYKTPSSNGSMKFLTENFTNKKKSDKEIWLFGLDISVKDMLETKHVLHELFQSVNMDLDDEVYIYMLDTKAPMTNYSLHEVYKIHDEGPPIINHLGSWSFDTYSLSFEDWDKNSRRHDLRGFTLRVTTLHDMPYIGLSQSDNGETIIDRGIFVEVFNEVTRLLNISYTTIVPPDGEWGALKDDGTWSGMVGQLHTKRVDIAVTDFTITEARSKVITFSNPIEDILHAVFIQNPLASYNYNAFTSPLADVTWLMFLVWALVTPPILYILARYGKCDQNINELTFPKTYVMVCGTFTQRGYNGVPTTWKARIAFTSFMVGGLLCYFHWEAMLISNLAKIVIPVPFSNMQELYKSDYRFTTLAASAFSDAFKNGDELWQLIFREKLELLDQHCDSAEDCLNWVLLDAKNAVYYEYKSFSTTEEFIDCKIIAAPGKYDIKPYAFGYQKHSPFAEMFDYHIEKLRQTGVLDTIKTKYHELEQKCPDLSGKPLSFGTVFTAFGVVLLGLNLSFALLLIEIITARYGCGRCKRIMNAYNYRITCNPNPPDMGWNVDRMRQLPISDNPW